MHKSEIDGEITGHDANQASDLSRSAARGTSVIPFVRRADTTSVCLAAGDDPPSSPAPFVPVGIAVAAVILRLRGGFPKLVLAPVGAGEDYDDWDEL